MNRAKHLPIAVLVAVFAAPCAAQQPAPATTERSYETRYAIGVIDDATFYANRNASTAGTLNRVLLEPTLGVKTNRFTASSSLIGATTTQKDTATQVLIREAYAGVSAGDFDLTAGRKLVRWGTGYAFTAAGVLDPQRIPTDPSDRLNLNEGRDMLKADWVHGAHAVTAAWSTAAFARKGTRIHDTFALRYNVLLHGFDTALIAGNDRGANPFGAITFTRVIGQACELHGELAWRQHQALLAGAKYTLSNGITFTGEFYTPPNTAYFRSRSLSPTAGRQHYAFLNAGKSRLRELPGWKEWDVSGAVVANLDDRSFVGILDASRWFGKHLSSYVHLEVPQGDRSSEYGAASYTMATSLGVRFHL